jgi:hypothetical protein
MAASLAATEPINLLATLDPWQLPANNAESIRLHDGVLDFLPGNYEPVALLTRDDYENFELEFEVKFEGWVEAGVYLHAPRNGAYRAGIEVELESHLGGLTTHSMGAIFRVEPPKQSWTKNKDWNACRIVMNWPDLTVAINGVEMQSLDLSQHPTLQYTLRRGAIGFQNQGWAYALRNVRLTPLPDTENGIALSDGKDLTGWSPIGGNAQWEVRDGALSVTKDSGYLRHDTVCRDFYLRLYVRTAPGANGGVFFRWPTDAPGKRGHEIQIFDYPGATMCTGSIYGLARADDRGIVPREWELLQLFVRGSKAVTFINGFKGAETDSLTILDPGWIVLQAHRDGATLEYRDLVLVPRDNTQ